MMFDSHGFGGSSNGRRSNKDSKRSRNSHNDQMQAFFGLPNLNDFGFGNSGFVSCYCKTISFYKYLINMFMSF